jgi:hypothetical protein
VAHVTIGLPLLIAHYERIVEATQVSRIIVDREGMATSVLALLLAAGRAVVTVLRSDQYERLASFCQIGEFVPARQGCARPDCAGSGSRLHRVATT